MKAMLYADCINLRRSLKAILWVVLVMTVAAFVFGGSAFVPFMVIMLSVMVPATLMSTDHAYGWDKLSLSLPISRRDVVSSKFAVSLLVNLAALTLGAALTALFCEMRGESLMENLCGLLACEAVGLLLMGLRLVLILKFGMERGRYFLVGVIWVPIIAVTVLEKHPAFRRIAQVFRNMDTWPGDRFTRLLGAAIAICVMLYVVCWFVGVKIYRGKEL